MQNSNKVFFLPSFVHGWIELVERTKLTGWPISQVTNYLSRFLLIPHYLWLILIQVTRVGTTRLTLD